MNIPSFNFLFAELSSKFAKLTQKMQWKPIFPRSIYENNNENVNNDPTKANYGAPKWNQICAEENKCKRLTSDEIEKGNFFLDSIVSLGWSARSPDSICPSWLAVYFLSSLFRYLNGVARERERTTPRRGVNHQSTRLCYYCISAAMQTPGSCVIG